MVLGAPLRFLAIEPESGIAHIHEHPPAMARAVAATMRAGGLRVAWYPAPPPPETPAQPSRRERRADRKAAREQERQFAELDVR